MRSYCYTHHVQEEMLSCNDIEIAARTWPNLDKLTQWRGKSPSWCDLGCRGCWNVIGGGVPTVEAGVGAFHAECYDKISQYIKETREALA